MVVGAKVNPHTDVAVRCPVRERWPCRLRAAAARADAMDQHAEASERLPQRLEEHVHVIVAPRHRDLREPHGGGVVRRGA